MVQFASGESTQMSDTFPSVLYVEGALVRAIGQDAQIYVGLEGYIAGVKRLLAESEHCDRSETDIIRRHGGVERLVGAFLERLMAEVFNNSEVSQRFKQCLQPENITLVITVPARARGEREESMRRILAELGYRHVKVLVESTAAAYRYARMEEYLPDGAPIVVFDCGAGTTDISVLEVRLRHNEAEGIHEREFTPLAELGVERGGMDLDDAFYDLVKSRLDPAEAATLAEQEKQESKGRSQKLLKELERIKLLMCGAGLGQHVQDSVILSVPGLIQELLLTREDLGMAIKPIVAEILAGVWEALQQAGARQGRPLSPPRIKKVYLVGGTTFVPWVRNGLRTIFAQDRIVGDADRMTSVARGAVASLFPIEHVAPVYYGYRTGKGDPVWIVYPGTVCPLAERALDLPGSDSPRRLEIVQSSDAAGSSPEAGLVTPVGTIDCTGIQSGTGFSLHYSVDHHALIHCSLHFQRDGESVQVAMSRTG